jgi:hypothetical protein
MMMRRRRPSLILAAVAFALAAGLAPLLMSNSRGGEGKASERDKWLRSDFGLRLCREAMRRQRQRLGVSEATRAPNWRSRAVKPTATDTAADELAEVCREVMRYPSGLKEAEQARKSGDSPVDYTDEGSPILPL